MFGGVGMVLKNAGWNRGNNSYKLALNLKYLQYKVYIILALTEIYCIMKVYLYTFMR